MPSQTRANTSVQTKFVTRKSIKEECFMFQDSNVHFNLPQSTDWLLENIKCDVCDLFGHAAL